MKDDYINRAEAIDAIENAFDKETILNRFVRKIAISVVRLLPAADVAPVVHGKWIRGKYTDDDLRYNDWSYRCNKCGKHVNYEECFCPKCGAKMDGNNEE